MFSLFHRLPRLPRVAIAAIAAPVLGVAVVAFPAGVLAVLFGGVHPIHIIPIPISFIAIWLIYLFIPMVIATALVLLPLHLLLSALKRKHRLPIYLVFSFLAIPVAFFVGASESERLEFTDWITGHPLSYSTIGAIVSFTGLFFWLLTARRSER